MRKQGEGEEEVDEESLWRQAFSAKAEQFRSSSRSKQIDKELQQSRKKLLKDIIILDTQTNDEMDNPQVVEKISQQQSFEVFTHLNTDINQNQSNKDEEDAKKQEDILFQKMNDYDKINHLLENEDSERAVQVALEWQLLNVPQCDQCKVQMKLQSDIKYLNGKIWRCTACSKKRKIYWNNCLFQSLQIPLEKLLYLFQYDLPHQTPMKQIKDRLKISQSVLSSARKLYLQALSSFHEYYHENMRKLGSRGEVVEIDESCFRRKHNRGRYRGTQWVFGMAERKGGFLHSVFLPVPDRKAQTLIPIIEIFISKQATLVLSDQWRAYQSLSQTPNSQSLNQIC